MDISLPGVTVDTAGSVKRRMGYRGGLETARIRPQPTAGVVTDCCKQRGRLSHELDRSFV
jgi:hypothetical protein